MGSELREFGVQVPPARLASLDLGHDHADLTCRGDGFSIAHEFTVKLDQLSLKFPAASCHFVFREVKFLHGFSECLLNDFGPQEITLDGAEHGQVCHLHRRVKPIATHGVASLPVARADVGLRPPASARAARNDHAPPTPRALGKACEQILGLGSARGAPRLASGCPIRVPRSGDPRVSGLPQFL
jgi:hypothetical protein